jgi:hypothetical protein
MVYTTRHRDALGNGSKIPDCFSTIIKLAIGINCQFPTLSDKFHQYYLESFAQILDSFKNLEPLARVWDPESQEDDVVESEC